jgi:cysteine desulfurase / selenocysteine lyase
VTQASRPLAIAGHFDVTAIRRDFPLLARSINGKPLAYLDNAASSQRPLAVIEAVNRYERMHHANVHRGVHTLSQEATDIYEGARDRIRRWLNARSNHECVFVRGTTEAINLVAQSYARNHLRSGDEVLITWLEHHSNIVPWQMVCEQTGARLVVAPMTRQGEIQADSVEALMTERTKIFACAHVSNALGTVLPIKRLMSAARARGIVTVIDGAQAVAHGHIDVQDIGCDFYALSGHKMYGPTGIGVLYGREALLESMPPWQGGGNMILTVRFDRTTYNSLPYKFEAGTPNISGAIGLGAAVDYLGNIDFAGAIAHEQGLLAHAIATLEKIPGIHFIGNAPERVGLVSFTLEGVHPHDLGTILDQEGIAIRSGHHCAMPVMEFFDLPATARASFALYNTMTEIDRLAVGVDRARQLFG